MKKLAFLFLGITLISWAVPPHLRFQTYYEKSNGLKTAPYHIGKQWWTEFANEYSEVSMQEYGMTDAGLPLHTITLSTEGKLLSQLSTTDKTIILINNAIHPGEPDGVDASMMLFRDVLFGRSELLDSCILVCIPYYNIGGALNRNSTTRANQNGPEEYGFRGNAQNLDLNRDFVKCDSKNAESFAKLLQLIDPDMYIETHVSNGADYQYTMTYLSTQPDKLGYQMGDHLRSKMIPEIVKGMDDKGNAIVPYVNHWGGPLKDSYATFYDTPRYSSGLTTLHNIYGFITETHMLKPFKQRVRATYEYLLTSLEYCNNHGPEIQSTRQAQKNRVAKLNSMSIDWEVDNKNWEEIQFKGYEYGYKKSEVSGEDRLFYNQSKPITKTMKFKNKMLQTKSKVKPTAYVLKRGYTAVEDRLRWNGVKLTELDKDTVMEVVSYKIDAYETVKQPYEKHYLHHSTKAKEETITWTFRKGDYLILMGTDKDRFILEMLEPEGPDSYFNWNFFDAVLQQKEHYSPYVFEDKAAEILKEDPTLDATFSVINAVDEMSTQDKLEWVYKNSEHYEKEHMRLPVFKVL